MKQFIFFILFLSLNSFSEELDDVWQITDYEDPDRIWVTVNGQITHGDKTRISLSPKDDSCNLAVTYTTFIQQSMMALLSSTSCLLNTW